jgi:hypothetical protein
MEKNELVITTAKEIFIKFGQGFFGTNNPYPSVSDFDERFKAVVKSVSEAFDTIKVSH